MSGRRKAENGGKTRKDAANRGAGEAWQEGRRKGKGARKKQQQQQQKEQQHQVENGRIGEQGKIIQKAEE